ncbi:MAG: porin [Burkholderiales bacterium]|nr:porin [Burkholderiales bacterium]
MKKSLIALAALGTLAGAAHAQSSVTIYGVVDASLESVKGTDSLTRVSSDNLATSRLGFKGTEDLGSGLKGKFVLEHNVKVDAGTQGNSARLWDRAAWIGLEGAFGEVRLGRQDSSIGLLAGNTNILGAQAYDDFKIAGTFAGDTYRRADNAITYLLPKFVDGLTAEVQYSTAIGSTRGIASSTNPTVNPGTETADVDTGKTWGLNVQYANGPFGVGGGYINAKRDAVGDREDEGWLVYASYDFGAAKLTGYFNQDEDSADDDKRKLYGIKVGVPLGAFTLQAGVSKVDNVNFAKDAEATIYALKGVYALSKRTALYALATYVDNDDGSALNVGAATTAGDSAHGIAIGVRHSF